MRHNATWIHATSALVGAHRRGRQRARYSGECYRDLTLSKYML